CSLRHDPPSPALSSLSLHDALPIFARLFRVAVHGGDEVVEAGENLLAADMAHQRDVQFLPVDIGVEIEQMRFEGRQLVVEHGLRSEEHTSELQSRENLVCRLLLEKK